MVAVPAGHTRACSMLSRPSPGPLTPHTRATTLAMLPSSVHSRSRDGVVSAQAMPQHLPFQSYQATFRPALDGSALALAGAQVVTFLPKVGIIQLSQARKGSRLFPRNSSLRRMIYVGGKGGEEAVYFVFKKRGSGLIQGSSGKPLIIFFSK